jgi:hypothetical protein
MVNTFAWSYPLWPLFMVQFEGESIQNEPPYWSRIKRKLVFLRRNFVSFWGRTSLGKLKPLLIVQRECMYRDSIFSTPCHIREFILLFLWSDTRLISGKSFGTWLWVMQFLPEASKWKLHWSISSYTTSHHKKLACYEILYTESWIQLGNVVINRSIKLKRNLIPSIGMSGYTHDLWWHWGRLITSLKVTEAQLP